jgi:hypothetical protein
MSEGTGTTEREIVVYKDSDGGPQVEVIIEGETVWLTQRQMSELFETSTDNVGRHIKNAYAEGELEEGATTEESSVVRSEGSREVSRRIRHYNLDVIISVGYRVKSKRGTQFRIWANGVLKDHLLRGYTPNEKRLLARGVEFDQAVALWPRIVRNRATARHRRPLTGRCRQTYPDRTFVLARFAVPPRTGKAVWGGSGWLCPPCIGKSP